MIKASEKQKQSLCLTKEKSDSRVERVIKSSGEKTRQNRRTTKKTESRQSHRSSPKASAALKVGIEINLSQSPRKATQIILTTISTRHNFH